MPPVEAVENSKLNPEAEEFVPLSRRVIPQDMSVSTSSS